MGVVYKAKDTHLERIVALKQLTESLKENENAVQLFEREARAAAALNHTNIVTLFDAGREVDTYFITMEFLTGRPLDVILEQHGKLPAGVVAPPGHADLCGAPLCPTATRSSTATSRPRTCS